MYSELLFLESPVQIGIVLLIALIVFGPNKLPEIGRQIGQALRELKKAGNEVMNSFNVDHEPEPYRSDPYSYDNTASYGYSTQYDYSVPHTSYADEPLDLTDYTIVGLPVKDGSHAEQTEAAQAAPTIGPQENARGGAGTVEEGARGATAAAPGDVQATATLTATQPEKEGTHND